MKLYDFSKRLMDLLLAGGAMLLLSPVIAAVALAVRIRLGAPILFRQPRPGFNEAIFDCLKFRTMTTQTDASGALLPDEDRMTSLGHFLRRTSLDELPQLWSVIRGDMSLVGPRPLLIRYLPRYSAEQRRRHTVKPGITGWSQVNGRNAIDWDRKLALDVWYVDHRSLLLDLKILFRTVSKVVTGSGVSRHGQVSMEEFFGNTLSSKEH